jgi:hypothetical protein
MDDDRQLRRAMFYALIGSIILGAVLGIAIVVHGAWNWFEVRVLLTTATIGVASVCGLACDLARTPRGGNGIAWAGIALTFVAAALVLGGMWLDIDAEAYWKATVCAVVLAVATVQVCLLSMARLARRFAWVFLVAWQVAYGVAGVICLMVVGETDSEGAFRLLAALAIIDAALTLAIPVLHRLSKLDEPGVDLLAGAGERNLLAIDAEILRLRERIASLEKLRAEIVG